MAARHEFRDHVADVSVELHAETLSELFVEAARALAELLVEQPVLTGAANVRRCSVTASDREALLVAFINELLYLSETEREVYEVSRVERASDTELSVELRGVPVEELRTQVKAATFHELAIRQSAEGLRAHLVLDV